MAPETPPAEARQVGMPVKRFLTRKYLLTTLLLGIAAAAAAWYLVGPIWELLGRGFRFLADRAAVEAYIASFGLGAPLIFMALRRHSV